VLAQVVCAGAGAGAVAGAAQMLAQVLWAGADADAGAGVNSWHFHTLRHRVPHTYKQSVDG
jgi:hypothetical protein